ncbi:hypothetical protein BDQ12DRAFT_604579, partial [Crucibulum laeve]
IMLAFTTLCLSFFLSIAHAFPLAQLTSLAQRDVFVPRITSPNADTVWPVGTKQTVTWDISNIPKQITNPIGKVILGHMENDNNPLAQNFNLTAGKVQITVPDVPPRDDYIIVLFGDSGNSSPSFVITRITGGSSSSATGTATTIRAASSSALITTPIPITGSEITGGSLSATPSPPIATETLPTGTTTTGSAPSSDSSAISSIVSSAASAISSAVASATSAGASQTAPSSNAAWQVKAPIGLASMLVGFVLLI